MNLKDLFPQPDFEYWQKIIQKELKEISFESLSFRNEDGIKIEPIYHAHQDFEQPVKTFFPQYVSFALFPHSKIGFINDTSIDINLSSYETLFISLPFSFIKKFKPSKESFLLIQDFFETQNFLNILNNMPLHLRCSCPGRILDLSYLQECGANNVDTLSIGIYIMEKLPRNIPLIVKVGVANQFYIEISKLRAFNYILQNFGFQSVKLWAKTAEINKTLLHLENNLIRLTSETISAVLGGCQYISILPFNLDYSDEFAIRISANILRIIEYEAYLNKVSDSLRGSYAIEKLTQSYITQIFQQFLFWKSIDSQKLWETFSQRTLANLKSIVSKYQKKEKLLVGVNIYPYSQEKRQETKLDFPQKLQPVRIAQLI